MSLKRQILFAAVIIIVIVAIISSWRCAPCRQIFNKNMTGEKIFLTTEDGIKIAGAYYGVVGEKGIVLAHQFGRDKSSWGDLPEFLQRNGFAVLAIDLRGHGESALDYRNFTDADFNKMTLDIETAINYLKEQGKTKIDIIGSSIGANLALIEKGKGNFAKVVALSPGLNFKGLDAEKAAKAIVAQKLLGEQILLAASGDDPYSYQSCELLEQIMDGASEFLPYSEGGHGVALLQSQLMLKSKILEFLQN